MFPHPSVLCLFTTGSSSCSSEACVGPSTSPTATSVGYSQTYINRNIFKINNAKPPRHSGHWLKVKWGNHIRNLSTCFGVIVSFTCTASCWLVIGSPSCHLLAVPLPVWLASYSNLHTETNRITNSVYTVKRGLDCLLKLSSEIIIIRKKNGRNWHWIASLFFSSIH